MPIRRLKHTFTSGELSHKMEGRVDFTGHKNGCKRLLNATVSVQGPIARRTGFKFIYDMTKIWIDTSYPYVRLIPFVRAKTEYYTLVFYRSTDGKSRVAFFNKDQLVYLDGQGRWSLALHDGWDIRNFDWAQTLDEIYMTQRALPLKKLVYYGPNNPDGKMIWELEGVMFDSEPADDPWSDEYGYPEKITFHQQRMILAATKLYRDKIWMSESGAILTFAPPSTPVASSALSFTLASGTYNRIQWISSSKAYMLVQLETSGL